MSRPVLLLFLGLAAALAGFGLLADRALVREAAASAALSSARSEPDARAAALSVRGARGQIEQDLLAGRSRAGVRQQMLALPPSLSAWNGRPYRGRSREELVSLLLSAEVTPWGLPEAVVAAIALGGPESRRDVVERLLAGQLPVRPEDLPHLASVMAVAGDPRVADLQRRLRSAPDPNDLPEAPGFRRTLTEPGIVEGWTRRGRASLRYEVPARALVVSAGVAERASLATRPGRGGAVGATNARPGVQSFSSSCRAERA